MYSGVMVVYIKMYIYNEVVMYIMCTQLLEHTLFNAPHSSYAYYIIICMHYIWYWSIIWSINMHILMHDTRVFHVIDTYELDILPYHFLGIYADTTTSHLAT